MLCGCWKERLGMGVFLPSEERNKEDGPPLGLVEEEGNGGAQAFGIDRKAFTVLPYVGSILTSGPRREVRPSEAPAGSLLAQYPITRPPD